MPNGDIQPEFKERLTYMGNWLKTYGASIYNTQGGYIKPQAWGCITQKNDTMFVHVLDKNENTLGLDNFPYKHIEKVYLLKNNAPVRTSLKAGVLSMILPARDNDEPDQVIVVVNEK